jgi:hypothetical protein
MNDDRLNAMLGSFYKGTPLTPPDAERSLGRVMTRLPQTRQRGRWWPLAIIGRSTVRPSGTSDTGSRPAPIPATNGPAPISTGRTRLMFSPLKAVLTGVLVFALGGVLFVAQRSERQGATLPAAESPSASPGTTTPTVATNVLASPIPTILGAETVRGTLTLEVTDLVGMEGLLLSAWDECFTRSGAMSWPVFLSRNQPIDASPFKTSGNVGLPVCSGGFHRLGVDVAETPESFPQYRCFTDFDLVSDEDIWIRIVGLPPVEAEARCALEYAVHDPAPMSWWSRE